ncbi:MAG: hypothetical protein OXN92_08050 [Gammaproteobacteria bacterium]|nr:hypothetical protein [Gammaproteobacteria bacterium]
MREPITRRHVVDLLQERVERGELAFGPEERTISVKVNGEAFTVRVSDELYPVPAIPLADLDLPPIALVEFEHDALELEFIRLERGVRIRT